MLSAIYPRMKAANPRAQIIIGGLLLECDYTHSYPDGRSCPGSKFLRGILRHGGGQNFDAVAYHGYPLQSTTRRDWERARLRYLQRGLYCSRCDLVVTPDGRHTVRPGEQFPLVQLFGSAGEWGSPE